MQTIERKQRAPRAGDSSPWGAIQTAEKQTDGIVFVSTAGHGGYWLSDERLGQMPAALRNAPVWAGLPWFEEDCDWAIVVLAFPDAGFSPYLRYAAFETFRRGDYMPQMWAAFLETPEGKAAQSYAETYLAENGAKYRFSSSSTIGKGWRCSACSLDGKRRIEFETPEYPELVTPFSTEDLNKAGITWRPYAPPVEAPRRPSEPVPPSMPYANDCGVFGGDMEYSDADPGL